MTMRMYRFRGGAPFDDAALVSLSGDPTASVVGHSGGVVVDLLVDDSRLADLQEVMTAYGFVYLSENPAAMRTHDFFAGLESPSKGSIVEGGEDFMEVARPVVNEDGFIMMNDDGTIMLNEPDNGPGQQGQGGGGGVGPVNEFSRADLTSVAKTLVFTGDDLTEVLLYSDEAKTLLNYTKTLSYNMSGQLEEVLLERASDTAQWTKTFGYTGDDLTSVVISEVP